MFAGLPLLCFVWVWASRKLQHSVTVSFYFSIAVCIFYICNFIFFEQNHHKNQYNLRRSCRLFGKHNAIVFKRNKSIGCFYFYLNTVTLYNEGKTKHAVVVFAVILVEENKIKYIIQAHNSYRAFCQMRLSSTLIFVIYFFINSYTDCTVKEINHELSYNVAWSKI